MCQVVLGGRDPHDKTCCEALLLDDSGGNTIITGTGGHCTALDVVQVAATAVSRCINDVAKVLGVGVDDVRVKPQPREDLHVHITPGIKDFSTSSISAAIAISIIGLFTHRRYRYGTAMLMTELSVEGHVHRTNNVPEDWDLSSLCAAQEVTRLVMGDRFPLAGMKEELLPDAAGEGVTINICNTFVECLPLILS